MFNFKELNIVDIRLMGNTINVKVENNNPSDYICPFCGVLHKGRVETKETFCFDSPINGRYVKIIFHNRVFTCKICDEHIEQPLPQDLGFYLTRKYYDEIAEKTLLDDSKLCPKEISELTGMSESDAEKLIDIIMLEHFVQV